MKIEKIMKDEKIIALVTGSEKNYNRCAVRFRFSNVGQI